MSVNATDAVKVARRYATAIFSLAIEAKKEKAVVEEFQALAAAIKAHAQLAETLNNPIITNAQKTDALVALAAGADKVTQRAIEVVAGGGRANVIPYIAEQLSSMLNEHQGELVAKITSARALPAATQKQLESSLANATGKTVQLDLALDPSVLGGLSIQLGSLRLDATLAGALTNMREQLLASNR